MDNPAYDPADRDDAGAAGGAAGGDSAGDSNLPPPLQPPENTERANPFQQQGDSTKYPDDGGGEVIELANMSLDEIGVPPDEVPLLTDLLSAENKEKVVDDTIQLIQDKFPQADFYRIDPIGWGKKPENQGEIVSYGKGKGGRYGETRILKKGALGLLKVFTDKFKKALGPTAEELAAEKKQEERALRQRLVEEEQQLKDKEKQAALAQQTTETIQNLRRRLEQTQAKREGIEEEHSSTLEQQKEIDRLKQLEKNLKADLENERVELKQLQKRQDKTLKEVKQSIGRLKKGIFTTTKERAEIELRLNRTKTLNELEEQYETLKRENEEDRKVVDDDNATSSEKQAATERIAERDEEIARLEPQIQEREEALPLRERVKNIFKKYGWTLQAVVLAVGLVLSALALAGLNGLKAGTKAVGQGLKTIGQKLGSLLPGLIGSIVSFIFKAVGQVFSFLAEHAWLLILAVVAFFMERLLKKRRKQ